MTQPCQLCDLYRHAGRASEIDRGRLVLYKAAFLALAQWQHAL